MILSRGGYPEIVRSGLLVVLVACSGSTAVPDAQPHQLQLDAVIADGGVTLHTNATDLAATGCIGQDAFPAPGTTGGDEDIVTCQHGSAIDSCLTRVALVIDGTEVNAQIVPGRAITMTGDVAAAGGGHLLIEGCGGSADIALPVDVVPHPTLAASVDATAGTITSTWSAVPPAASALITMNTGLWDDEAHVTSSPYTFTVGAGGSVRAYTQAMVTTFAPPTTAATSFGPIHLWTGASANVLLQ